MNNNLFASIFIILFIIGCHMVDINIKNIKWLYISIIGIMLSNTLISLQFYLKYKVLIEYDAQVRGIPFFRNPLSKPFKVFLKNFIFSMILLVCVIIYLIFFFKNNLKIII
jgi:glycerol uptake facilitator-like aquaporin